MASTGVHGQNVFGENVAGSAPSRVQAKLFDFQTSSVARQSLQTLQFSSTSDKELVSKNGPVKPRFSKSGSKGLKPHKKKLIKPSHKPVEVFRDPSPTASKSELSNAEEEALQLMSGDNVPDSYWKMLAEERRTALDDSLHENEMLHNEIQNLKDENSRLTELAGQAEYLASILQTAIESSSDDEDGSPLNKSEVNEKVESYLSSYEVISLTDEQAPSISDAEEAGESISPTANKTDSDTDTLCSAAQDEEQSGSSTSPKSSRAEPVSPNSPRSDPANTNTAETTPASPKSPETDAVSPESADTNSHD